ncbi:hypothetical protein DYB25_009992 [Aphanomyces astaci]|uniref:Uncharacterized protein n=1 Tax=Aphanomyces astaci TaxID=112090 RepID=A0A397A6Z8_APHAT|nr:hypothetical protein DYB25_009992 [Aphanomyces astaci]
MRPLHKVASGYSTYELLYQNHRGMDFNHVATDSRKACSLGSRRQKTYCCPHNIRFNDLTKWFRSVDALEAFVVNAKGGTDKEDALLTAPPTLLYSLILRLSERQPSVWSAMLEEASVELVEFLTDAWDDHDALSRHSNGSSPPAYFAAVFACCDFDVQEVLLAKKDAFGRQSARHNSPLNCTMSTPRRMSVQGSLSTFLSSINSRRSLTQLARKASNSGKVFKSMAQSILIKHATNNARGWETYYRLFSNCSEFGFVAAFLTTIVILYYSGLWHRQTTTGHVPSTVNWSTIGSQCTLTPLGFVGCSSPELAVVSTAVWTAIGQSLDQQLSSNVALKMTTCVIGTSRGYGAVVFVLAPDMFSTCSEDVNPPVAMLAMLETSTNDATATPTYLLSILNDEPSPPRFQVKDDTSGDTSTEVATHVTKVFISDTGVTSPAAISQTNWRFQSQPLGRRYTLSFSCSSEFIMSTDGFTGLLSRKTWIVGWTCRHDVSNWAEVAICQMGLIAILVHWVGGDLLLTFLGLQGFLLGKPVLTYDFLSGLERRKRTVVLLMVSRLVTLMYTEITRLYVDTPSHGALFVMSCFMLSGLFVCAVYCSLLVIQRLPCPQPWRFKAVRIQGPLFVTGTTIFCAMASAVCDLRQRYHDPIWTLRTPSLLVVVPNATSSFATGAFTELQVAPVSTILAPVMLKIMGVMLGIAVVLPMLYHRQVVIDLAFMKRNEFLHTTFVPSYVTALPLYETDCIRYGGALVVKPSTLALLGYAMLQEHKIKRRSLVEVMPKATKEHDPHYPLLVIVTVYDLLPCLLLPWIPWTPTIVGTVKKYAFTKAPRGTKLPRRKKYVPTKGSCVS